MINVLVVDSDRLERTVLISEMPWQRFDMQVVGEAKNGEEALKFVEANKVDLLLADLSMPVMSGIELIRIMREKYPNTIVVLMLHQDYEYIEEALKLGAIDYIAKVEMEKGRYEEVLCRIHRLFLNVHMREYILGEPSRYKPNTAYVLLTIEKQADAQWMDETIISTTHHITEIDNYIWFWVPEDGVDQDPNHYNFLNSFKERTGWWVIKLEGIAGKSHKDVYRLLRDYRHWDFFYDDIDDKSISTRSIQAMHNDPKFVSEQMIDMHKRQWLSFDWIQQEPQFLRLRNELKEMRLPVSQLTNLLYEIAAEWNRIYTPVTSLRIVLMEGFNKWQDTAHWLINFRETVLGLERKQLYSQDIFNSIMEAVKIVQKELDQSVYAVEVAKRVNMSRSYFNQCFKDIVGHSFNEYLRVVRVGKAKEYLLQTNKPIQWISERTGYMDDKYFSRIFYKETGFRPSVYRKDKKG